MQGDEKVNAENKGSGVVIMSTNYDTTLNDMSCGNRQKMAYAMLTRHCNLSCPYCDVKSMKDDYDQDAFMNAIREFDGSILLFGGEPTLYRDRLKHVMYSDPEVSKKIRSMTTNLMILDDELMSIMGDLKSVGTSWNPSRFRNGEYEIWKHNLDAINGRFKFLIIITMSSDLLQMDPDDIIDTIKSWNSNSISIIAFEHYVGPEADPEYFNACDELLCEIYKRWGNTPIEFRNVRMVRGYKYNYFCNHTHTITPNGVIKLGCAQNQYNTRVTPVECYTCERSGICKPCRLQRYCSYPKKFAKLVNETLGIKGGPVSW